MNIRDNLGLNISKQEDITKHLKEGRIELWNDSDEMFKIPVGI